MWREVQLIPNLGVWPSTSFGPWHTLLTFIFSYRLLSTLTALQNAKTLLIWSVYANLLVIQSLAIILEINSGYWRYVQDLYDFIHIRLYIYFIIYVRLGTFTCTYISCIYILYFVFLYIKNTSIKIPPHIYIYIYKYSTCMDKNTLHLRTKWVLIQVCIHDVFKDEYFLHYPCIPYLEPKIIVAINSVIIPN